MDRALSLGQGGLVEEFLMGGWPGSLKSLKAQQIPYFIYCYSRTYKNEENRKCYLKDIFFST